MRAQFIFEYQEAAFRLDLTGEVPMTIPELLAILERRGLQLTIKDGVPILRGDKREATQPLMECLKVHKPEILEYLRKQQEETPVA